MRAGRDAQILKNEHGRFIGISLGADFVAEHEFGTEGLDHSFGINRKDETKLGLDRRIATEVPTDKIFFGEAKRATYLIVNRYYGHGPFDPTNNRELQFSSYNNDEPFITAWADGDFGIATKDKKVAKQLKELRDAMLKKDFAFWVGRGVLFGNGGLILVIASRVPADAKQVMEDNDTEHQKLEKTVQRTGIREKLKEAGCKYYALSPRFKSNGQLEFWLNPQEQDKNNCGWFDTRDLLNWTKGVGRIPK